MIGRAMVILVGLIVLVAGTSWVAKWLTPISKTAQPVRHEADFYLADFTATALDAQGRPQHRLQAERMVHYGDDDTAELTRPQITTFDDQGPTWSAQSATGWVSPNGKVVRLLGPVTMVRVDRGSGPARIETRDLTLHPDDDFAETAAPVRFSDARGFIMAVGMRAQLGDNGHLELLSRVRGIRENEKPNH